MREFNPKHSLTRLSCGSLEGRSDLGDILRHLSSTLDSLLSRRNELLKSSESEQLAVYGPFVGRSILEVGLTALVARLDPFRVLVIRQLQLHSKEGFVFRRNRAALQWSGDILPESKVDNLWDVEKLTPAKITRALLGDYYDHVFWRPSFQALMDYAPDDAGGEWLRSMRRLEPEAFAPNVRKDCESNFSACSKGVHHEFVIPQGANYDSEVMKRQMLKSVEICAKLSLTANMSDHLAYHIDRDEALETFKKLQEDGDDDGISGD